MSQQIANLEAQWGGTLERTAIAKIPPAQGPVNPAVDRAIKEFVEFANKTVSDHRDRLAPNLPVVTLLIEWGPRFARIVRDEGGPMHRSAFGFVDRTNGDILKSASWKAPAAGARGNVLDRSTWAGSHSPYGMTYRRAARDPFWGLKATINDVFYWIMDKMDSYAEDMDIVAQPHPGFTTFTVILKGVKWHDEYLKRSDLPEYLKGLGAIPLTRKLYEKHVETDSLISTPKFEEPATLVYQIKVKSNLVNKTALNKFNAPEMLGALFTALEAAGLEDTVVQLRKLGVPRIINESWSRRGI